MNAQHIAGRDFALFAQRQAIGGSSCSGLATQECGSSESVIVVVLSYKVDRVNFGLADL
jgi:hypothetical protein